MNPVYGFGIQNVITQKHVHDVDFQITPLDTESRVPDDKQYLAGMQLNRNERINR